MGRVKTMTDIAGIWPDIHATKIEAAKRQLDAGVRMLFMKEDALATHTVAFAAYGLLKDLSEKCGRTDTLARLETDAKLRNGNDFWHNLKKLADFLKHADHDSDDVIAGVPEELNECALLIDCYLLRDLSGLNSHESQTLWLWYHAIYFIDMEDTPKEFWEWVTESLPALHSGSREQLIDAGAQLLQKLKQVPFKQHRMEPEQILLPWRLVIHPTMDAL
jgi:hypothetical protein